jgi:hypothetical protein
MVAGVHSHPFDDPVHAAENEGMPHRPDERGSADRSVQVRGGVVRRAVAAMRAKFGRPL